jgi:hypothetical protein
MPFAIIILIQVFFIACMVFIIGYVFGNFSTKPALRIITKISSILADRVVHCIKYFVLPLCSMESFMPLMVMRITVGVYRIQQHINSHSSKPGIIRAYNFLYESLG